MSHGTILVNTAQPQSRSRVSVLVIDDDDDFRELMRLYLPEKEFAVSEARDGMAGLKLLREHEFDLIVLDLIMPECDGMQFIRSMRNAYFTTRILAVSGAAERALYLHMAAMLGANLICEKPITRERFYDGLRQLRVEFPNQKDLRLPDNNSRKLC